MSLASVQVYDVTSVSSPADTSGATTGMLSIQNITVPSIGPAEVITTLSATNEFALVTVNRVTNTFYYKYTIQFQLVNQSLSTTGQYAIYLFLAPFDGTTLYPNWLQYPLQVEVVLSANGMQSSSAVFPVAETDRITWTPVSSLSAVQTVPVFLSNLFPNMIQNTDVIYEACITITTATPSS